MLMSDIMAGEKGTKMGRVSFVFMLLVIAMLYMFVIGLSTTSTSVYHELFVDEMALGLSMMLVSGSFWGLVALVGLVVLLRLIVTECRQRGYCGG